MNELPARESGFATLVDLGTGWLQFDQALDELRAGKTPQRRAPTVVLFCSGQHDPRNIGDWEDRLHAEVQRRLCLDGYNFVRCSASHKRRKGEAAGVTERDQRISAATALIAAISESRPAFPLVLIGLSIGADAVVQILASPQFATAAIAGALLIGWVQETPVAILGGIRDVRLMFGENDGIAFVSPEGIFSRIQTPSEYGPNVAKLFVVKRSQTVSIDIIASAGHLLQIKNESAEPVGAKIYEYIVNALC